MATQESPEGIELLTICEQLNVLFRLSTAERTQLRLELGMGHRPRTYKAGDVISECLSIRQKLLALPTDEHSPTSTNGNIDL